MPGVYNRRAGGVPEDAVYVGQSTKWGNPYAPVRDERNRQRVIDAYERHLYSSGLIEQIGELRGKDLVCWCAPKACHADVLLRLANA